MKRFVFIMIFSILLSCKKEEAKLQTFEYNFTFANGTESWQSFFSDYPVSEEDFYKLVFIDTLLPAPLDQTVKSLKISGNNHSDDLFSAIYRKFSNLEPNKTYLVTFNIEFASDAIIGGVGAGGDPNLALGAGCINYLPAKTIDNLNYYRNNFPSLIQSGQSNEVFKILGGIGVSENYPTPFKLINRNNIGNPVTIKANSNGDIWLIIATDSGYEGTTTLYYKSINVKIE
jgi:hypothetical protein